VNVRPLFVSNPQPPELILQGRRNLPIFTGMKIWQDCANQVVFAVLKPRRMLGNDIRQLVIAAPEVEHFQNLSANVLFPGKSASCQERHHE
jgi:hypothetical protein